MGGEQRVLGERHARHRAATEALFGHEAHAAVRRWSGVMRPASMPQICTGNFSASGASPEIAYSNSCWPLPETPAMPTISPACTSRWISLRSVPKGSSEACERPASRSLVSPPPVDAPCSQTGRSLPIISRAIEAGVSCEGMQLPVTLPPRSTVAVWQSSWISSSLWLM